MEGAPDGAKASARWCVSPSASPVSWTAPLTLRSPQDHPASVFSPLFRQHPRAWTDLPGLESPQRASSFRSWAVQPRLSRWRSTARSARIIPSPVSRRPCPDLLTRPQTACRRVVARGTVGHLLGGLAEGGKGWAEMCRSNTAVQRETTGISTLLPAAVSPQIRLLIWAPYTVTSILLVAGTLSALTAAWWGALADRKGRKVVLFAGSVAELLEAGIMVLFASSSLFTSVRSNA